MSVNLFLFCKLTVSASMYILKYKMQKKKNIGHIPIEGYYTTYLTSTLQDSQGNQKQGKV